MIVEDEVQVIMLERVLCPKCKGDNIGFRYFSRENRCRTCGFVWKEERN